MKFDIVVGNPPYQGDGKQQVYADFYLLAQQIANEVELIFPTGWQKPTNANNLGKLNTPKVKEDPQIVYIDNRHNVFDGVSGAEWTNIILWKKGYHNGLEGKQKIFTDGRDPKEIKIPIDKSEIIKPKEIIDLANLVEQEPGFLSVQTITSVRKPYGLSTDVVNNNSKYNLPPIENHRMRPDDYQLWTGGRKGRVIKYVPHNYPFPVTSPALHFYKILVPYAWGNWSESSGLGGSFSDIIIAFPEVATTETWLEQGQFSTFEMAKKHAKYMLTKFFRALLYRNKYSQHSTTAWKSIPVQDFSEDWWDAPISELENHLFDKYNVPESIRLFVLDNFQTKDESNIINF